MENMGFVALPAITVICYLVAELIKATPLNSKWLPAICGVLGAALGVVAMLVIPEYAGQDILTAIAVGIVSGLAATGANQVGKQLSDKDN